MIEKTGSTTALRKTFSSKIEGDALDTLRLMGTRRSYPANTILCQQGQVEHTFYVIIQGRVAAKQQLEDGEERLLSLLGPNEYFGEMGLLDNTPRMATCVTLVPTTVLEINEDVFDKVVEESPAVAYAITRHILATMRNLDRLAIRDLTKKNEALQAAYSELQAAQLKLVEKERLERELELAATVQRSLLPNKLPQFPDYHFAAYLRPARIVGGDFYDVIELDDEHVGLLLADVADKGFHAAMFMAVTRTLFRQEGRHTLSPAQVTLAVHRGMLDIAPTHDVFVTAFYAVLHRPSGRLTYVRAAQERPLLMRADGSIEELPGNGRFLGMLPDLSLEEHTIQLQPGDRLVLFSDGVTDATNWQDEQYDHPRFMAALQAGARLSADALVQHLVTDVVNWCQESPAFDDLTLLVTEVRETE